MIALAAIWGRVWAVVGPILAFGITLPVWAFLAAGIWLWWDRTSAVRQAVNGAVTELVAGAEIEAANARAAAEKDLRILAQGRTDEARRRAEAAESANAQLAARGALDALENERMADELAKLEAMPSDPACTVGPDDLGRLRNR